MKEPDRYDGYEGGAPYWIGPSDRKFNDYHEYIEEVKEYEESCRRQKEQEEKQKRTFEEALKNCYTTEVERILPHEAGDNIYTPNKKAKFIIYRDKDTNRKIYEKIKL